MILLPRAIRQPPLNRGLSEEGVLTYIALGFENTLHLGYLVLLFFLKKENKLLGH